MAFNLAATAPEGVGQGPGGGGGAPGRAPLRRPHHDTSETGLSAHGWIRMRPLGDPKDLKGRKLDRVVVRRAWRLAKPYHRRLLGFVGLIVVAAVLGALPPQIAAGQPPKLVINMRQDQIDDVLVALRQFDQHLCDLVWVFAAHILSVIR